MTDHLTQAQLSKLVAEVGRLSDRQNNEIDRQQVEEILQELGLPVALLDDAMIQIQRREALAVQQRRNRWIGAGVVAGLVLAIAAAAFFFQQHQQSLAQVSVQQDQITLGSGGGSLTTIPRQPGTELVYQVTLNNAPVGKTLNLSCNWITPRGDIVKQNRYQTREIKTSVWQTYCRYPLSETDPPGQWTVKMYLDGRFLSDASFEVR